MFDLEPRLLLIPKRDPNGQRSITLSTPTLRKPGQFIGIGFHSLHNMGSGEWNKNRNLRNAWFLNLHLCAITLTARRQVRGRLARRICR
jgi:hypothetical protein